MRPAFASTGQAAWFALLLGSLLALPALLPASWLPSREELYSSIWWANGGFPYIQKEIFHEKGDIDIAFVGPSHIWNSFDTPYVQEKLSEKLGRPAVVRTLSWGGPGYDAMDVIARDLLAHRKVHMLVFYDDGEGAIHPHNLAPSFFRWNDSAAELAGLSWRLQATYYYASVVGLPRTLLSAVRANLPADLDSPKKTYWGIVANAENIPAHLGAMVSDIGYASSAAAKHLPFQVFNPPAEKRQSDVVIYSLETKADFKFEDTVPGWQLHFAQRFAEIAQKNSCKLVLVSIPQIKERDDMFIWERAFWPEALHADVAMVGIPPAMFFEGMSEDEIYRLYSDPGHLNKNGQVYFTAIITPSLLQLYDAAPSH